MRQLVRYWKTAPTEQLCSEVVRANILNKATRARAADVLRRTYVPRFIEGPIPNAWKLVRPLEDLEANPQILVPVYYWITAQAEPMISDFVRDFLFTKRNSARAGIEQREVIAWLQEKGCSWSPTVSLKVTRGLLAALRDFGILEGAVRKRLTSVRLPTVAFAYLAFCLSQSGVTGRNLLSHSDWQLFLLTNPEVEHHFLEAHQLRLLEYHAAGSTISLVFPTQKLEEYANVVVERSHQLA